MTTKLQGPLKRELDIGGNSYIVTIDPVGFKLVPKGKRKGYALDWQSIVNGDAALATALNATLAAAPPPLESKRKAQATRRSSRP